MFKLRNQVWMVAAWGLIACGGDPADTDTTPVTDDTDSVDTEVPDDSDDDSPADTDTTTGTDTDTETDVDTDNDTDDGTANDTAVEAPGPSFAATVYPAIQSDCAYCHVSGSLGGLAMPNANDAYDALVGAPSTINSAYTRVVAGNADDSYFYLKVSGNLPAGDLSDPMPSGSPWSTNKVAAVRAWIEGGAQP